MIYIIIKGGTAESFVPISIFKSMLIGIFVLLTERRKKLIAGQPPEKIYRRFI